MKWWYHFAMYFGMLLGTFLRIFIIFRYTTQPKLIVIKKRGGIYMGGDAFTFKLFGLMFDWTNIISGLIVFVIVFFLLFGLSRKLQMKPKGGQNIIEWIIDFTNGIVRGQMPADEAPHYNFMIFVLFVFVFVSNQFGLLFNISWNGNEILRSPTADPIITMTMAMIVMTLTHFAGVAKNGFGGYLKSFCTPYTAMLPINLFEEFSNFLTLGLRLFGNIYAGELLLKLVAGMAFSHGIPTMIVSLPLEIVWQGFSIFIGSVQAYVFVTLTSVYISSKVSTEE